MIVNVLEWQTTKWKNDEAQSCSGMTLQWPRPALSRGNSQGSSSVTSLLSLGPVSCLLHYFCIHLTLKNKSNAGNAVVLSRVVETLEKHSVLWKHRHSSHELEGQWSPRPGRKASVYFLAVALNEKGHQWGLGGCLLDSVYMLTYARIQVQSHELHLYRESFKTCGSCGGVSLSHSLFLSESLSLSLFFFIFTFLSKQKKDMKRSLWMVDCAGSIFPIIEKNIINYISFLK